jgi:hypothetical protein
MDSKLLIDGFYYKDREIATYTALKEKYETDRATYNLALEKETARNQDLISMWFNAAIKIPARPCQPTIPTAYEGPKIDWDVTNNVLADISAANKAGGYGTLDRMQTAIMPKPSLNSGFVQVAPDISAGITPNITFAAHTFGLLG